MYGAKVLCTTLLRGMMLVDKVTVLINGYRKLDLNRFDPIARLLVLDKPEDYKHSVAPNKVILEFDNGSTNTYELVGCPRCMNEAAKKL